MNVFCVLLLFILGFNQAAEVRVRKRWYLPQTQSSTQQRNYHIPYYLYGQGHNQTFYTTNRDPNLVYYNRKPPHWAARINNDKTQTKYDINEQGNSDIYSSAYMNKNNYNSMYKNEIKRQLLRYIYLNDDRKPQQKQYLAYAAQLQSKDSKETNSRDKIEDNSAKTIVNSPPSSDSVNDVKNNDTVAQSQLINLESMNKTDEVTITSTGYEENENLDAEEGIDAKHRKIKTIVSQIPAEYLVSPYKKDKAVDSVKKIEANLSATSIVNSPHSSNSFNDVKNSDTVAQSQLINLESMNKTDEVIITSTENVENENLEAADGINAKRRKIKIIVSQIPAKYTVTSYKNDEAVDSVKIPENNNDPLSILTDNKQESTVDSPTSLLDNTRRQNNDFDYENSANEVKDIDNLLSYFMSQNEPVIANEDWYRYYLGALKTNDEENTLSYNYQIYPDIENSESIKDNSIDRAKVNLENKQMENEIIQLANLLFKTNYITNPYNGDDEKGYAIYPVPSSSLGDYEFNDIGNQNQLVNFEPIKKVDEVTSNGNENYENLLTIKDSDANHKKDNKIVSPKPTNNLVIENSMDDDTNIKSEENWSSTSLNTVDHNKKSRENDNVDKNSMYSVQDNKLSTDPVSKNIFASQKDMNVDPIDQNTPIMAHTYSYRDILYLLNKIKQNEENNISNERNNEAIHLLPINYQIYPESNDFGRIYGYPEDRPKSHRENEWMKQREIKSNNPLDVTSKINIDNKRYTVDVQENTLLCPKRPGHINKRPQKMTEIEEMDTTITRRSHPKIRKRFTIRLIKHIGESDLPLQAKIELLAKALDESHNTNLQYNTLNGKETPIDKVSDIYEYNKGRSGDDQMAPAYNVRYKSQQKVPEEQILEINEVKQSFDDPDYDVLDALINENIGKFLSNPRQKDTILQTETAPQETSKSEDDKDFRSLKSKVTHQLFNNPEDELEIQTSSPLVSYNYERQPIPKLTSKFGTLTEENANSLKESTKIQQNEDIVKSQSDLNTTVEKLKPEDVSDKMSKNNTETSMKVTDSPIIYISMSPNSNMSRGKKSPAFRGYFNNNNNNHLFKDNKGPSVVSNKLNADQQASKENATNTTNATNAPDASKVAFSDHNKNMTEQPLKENNKTEIIAANNTDLGNWTEILINALFSEALSTDEALRSKESSQKALNEPFISNSLTNSSERIQESEKITLIQHLNQILDIMVPDLLKLYNTCHTRSNEELLKEWKILIDSTLKKCETKSKL